MKSDAVDVEARSVIRFDAFVPAGTTLLQLSVLFKTLAIVYEGIMSCHIEP